MKTLDEVIKAWEFCPAHPETCEGCPYEREYRDVAGANSCYLDDAFAWLKGYQVHIELDKLREKCEVENNPLTWDELITMVGKPVWVENDGWEIIDNCTSIDFVSISGAVFRRHDDECYGDYGKDWFAYRKEKQE